MLSRVDSNLLFLHPSAGHILLQVASAFIQPIVWGLLSTISSNLSVLQIKPKTLVESHLYQTAVTNFITDANHCLLSGSYDMLEAALVYSLPLDPSRGPSYNAGS